MPGKIHVGSEVCRTKRISKEGSDLRKIMLKQRSPRKKLMKKSLVKVRPFGNIEKPFFDMKSKKFNKFIQMIKKKGSDMIGKNSLNCTHSEKDNDVEKSVAREGNLDNSSDQTVARSGESNRLPCEETNEYRKNEESINEEGIEKSTEIRTKPPTKFNLRGLLEETKSYNKSVDRKVMSESRLAFEEKQLLEQEIVCNDSPAIEKEFEKLAVTSSHMITKGRGPMFGKLRSGYDIPKEASDDPDSSTFHRNSFNSCENSAQSVSRYHSRPRDPPVQDRFEVERVSQNRPVRDLPTYRNHRLYPSSERDSFPRGVFLDHGRDIFVNHGRETSLHPQNQPLRTRTSEREEINQHPHRSTTSAGQNGQPSYYSENNNMGKEKEQSNMFHNSTARSTQQYSNSNSSSRFSRDLTHYNYPEQEDKKYGSGWHGRNQSRSLSMEKSGERFNSQRIPIESKKQTVQMDPDNPLVKMRATPVNHQYYNIVLCGNTQTGSLAQRIEKTVHNTEHPPRF